MTSLWVPDILRSSYNLRIAPHRHVFELPDVDVLYGVCSTVTGLQSSQVATVICPASDQGRDFAVRSCPESPYSSTKKYGIETMKTVRAMFLLLALHQIVALTLSPQQTVQTGTTASPPGALHLGSVESPTRLPSGTPDYTWPRITVYSCNNLRQNLSVA